MEKSWKKKSWIEKIREAKEKKLWADCKDCIFRSSDPFTWEYYCPKDKKRKYFTWEEFSKQECRHGHADVIKLRRLYEGGINANKN